MDRAGDTDDVTDIGQIKDLVGLVTDLVAAEVDLDAPRAVSDVGKGSLAHAAQSHDPPGDSDAFLLEFLEAVEDLAGGVVANKRVGEGLDLHLLQPGELGPAYLHQIIQFFLMVVLHSTSLIVQKFNLKISHTASRRGARIRKAGQSWWILRQR
ncbi:MAG: hypothetical protein BWY77_01653 [bacterium ADurb.Bin431]|nr:MAG: hypothetical protein BWY77_01653 [bacterium ADurb.Bin431]